MAISGWHFTKIFIRINLISSIFRNYVLHRYHPYCRVRPDIDLTGLTFFVAEAWLVNYRYATFISGWWVIMRRFRTRHTTKYQLRMNWTRSSALVLRCYESRTGQIIHVHLRRNLSVVWKAASSHVPVVSELVLQYLIHRVVKYVPTNITLGTRLSAMCYKSDKALHSSHNQN
jgi:hypothetical protein